MKKMSRKCSFESCERSIWARGFCQMHDPKPKKPLKSRGYIKKVTPNSIKKKEEKKEFNKLMLEGFIQFFKNHPTRCCEECSRVIREEYFGTINVHHTLPKANEKYKSIALNPKYWMLLCQDCHSSWEISNKGDKIRQRTEENIKIFENE